MTPPINSSPKNARRDPWYIRVPLIGLVTCFLAIFVVVPLINVFVQASQRGWDVAIKALENPATLSAVRITLITAACSVVFNLLFGIAAAWAIARFQFQGKTLLTSLIDLPFSVSPVIAGLIFVLLFGARGYFAQTVGYLGIEVIFALPGVILATTFVTVPFIARELIPIMRAVGSDEEQAARTLGASGWQMFRMVTLPNIKWGLLYGVLLCNARAIGEFGAVNVVSGKIEGKTETLPLYIEKLYQGLGATATASAFTVAALLACLALLTLFFKTFLEWKTRQQLLDATRSTESQTDAGVPV